MLEMKIEIQITPHSIEPGFGLAVEFSGVAGAVAEFSGVVRDQENGESIAAIEYEAFSPMAENEMRRILSSLAEIHPCLAAKVVHRVGIIPVGATAIQVVILARHRDPAFAMLAEFMNLLKKDVPIWKRLALPLHPSVATASPLVTSAQRQEHVPSLSEAIAEICSHVNPLDAVTTSWEQSAGRMLMETVCAPEDLPANDRSTRDGYGILLNDASTKFRVVDTLHAADWKPRELKSGEAVRVATGSTLPCENMRVIMQEDVQREGDQIKTGPLEEATNVRRRGEDISAGQPVLTAGTLLSAGELALLATVGCTRPKVRPRLRILHFTTGDEVVPPDQKPMPGQIRDSNSILIRGFLHNFPCDLWQQKLPEDFGLAKLAVGKIQARIQNADVVLVSGGASVGDKDFTRELLEVLGFQIIFRRVKLRPGAPRIFGQIGSRIDFGIPGTTLSHFVIWHGFVKIALARLTGAIPPTFSIGWLATALNNAECPRETLWPARCQISGGKLELTPLRWNSAGDLTCLATANALVRVPAGTADLPAGANIEFLSTAV